MGGTGPVGRVPALKCSEDAGCVTVPVWQWRTLMNPEHSYHLDIHYKYRRNYVFAKRPKRVHVRNPRHPGALFHDTNFRDLLNAARSEWQDCIKYL